MTDLERGAEAVRLTNEEERKSNNEQTCYTKEELEELANTGCWNTARKVLLLLFWIVWIGAIAWSIFIVIKSPKCKAEPEQAWFTSGAIGLIEGDDPVALIEASEAGQYSAFLVAGLIPPFKDLLQAGNVEEMRQTSEQLATLAKSKGSKLLFKVDLAGSDEKLSGDRYTEYFNGYFGENSDGFVFTGADAEVVSGVRNVNKNHDLFYGVQSAEMKDIAANREENEYFYQDLGGDVCKEVECIANAEDVIRKTAIFANETSNIVDDIVETLWFGQTSENGLSSEIVLTSTLPGGFIVPVVDTEDKDAYTHLITLRGNTHSLRAIKGAEIEFNEQSIRRKFDLRPEVVVTTETIEDKEPKFVSEKSIFKIFVN